MVSAAVAVLGSKLRANSSMSGRPLARQVAWWDRQSGVAPCGHSSQRAIEQRAPGSGGLTAGALARQVSRSGRPKRSHRWKWPEHSPLRQTP
jgi:hypothetical protein